MTSIYNKLCNKQDEFFLEKVIFVKGTRIIKFKTIQTILSHETRHAQIYFSLFIHIIYAIM
jgi:hypothetical protein